MDHAQPGSASVVSWVAFEEMETIDRVPLIHREMANRVSDAVVSAKRRNEQRSPSACRIPEEPYTDKAR